MTNHQEESMSTKLTTERANFIRNLAAANGGEVLFSDDQRMEVMFSFDEGDFTLSHFFNIELAPRGGRWLAAAHPAR
jgi:hypothetical protein